MSNVDSLLEVINEVAGDLDSALEGDFSPDVDRWIDQHGLDQVDNPTPVLCKLTAYNWLLKTSLYGLYRVHGYDLPPLQSADDIQSKLSSAADETNDHAFHSFALDAIAGSVDADLFASLLEARHLLIDTDDPLYDIAHLFETIVPQAARRKLGQFQTPRQVADLMAGWAVESGDDVVLDPGMGAGILTASMYEAKQSKYGRTRVEDMWGVDLSELAVVMSSTTLKLVNGDGRPRLLHEDFMDVTPKGSQKRFTQVSSASIPKLDAIVSNPPYSRHHTMDEMEKSRVNDIAETDSAMSLSKTAPMYMYFYIHAAEFLQEGGRMAFVTPSEFLETNYGEQLKEFLLNNFRIQGLLLYDQETSIFNEARTTSCVSFLEKYEGGDDSCGTTFIKLDSWPGKEPVVDAIESGRTGGTDYGYVNRVPQGTLDPDVKWTKYFDSDPETKITGLRPFREIADIKRGIATGANEYFCLSEEERKEWELDESYFAPIIRRSDSTPYYNCTTDDWRGWSADGNAVQLLYHLPDSREEIEDDALGEYLDQGIEADVDERYLARKRNPWYLVDRRDVPDILGTYMSKSGFRFIQNQAGIRSLNNFHNITLNDAYTENQTKALLAYLNSGIVYDILSQESRTYSENMEKIEPNELKEIPVIDPAEIGADASARLRRCFEDLCEAKRNPDIIGQSPEVVIDEIDEFLEGILNIHRESNE
jgi:adenine-specific DNA-methyltransferase